MMSGEERIPWIRPDFEPDDALMRELREILESGRVTNDGPRVARLEAAVSTYLGVEEVVAVGSGSAALHLSAVAMGGGGRVILPSFTYIATLAAVLHAGFDPVFCDVDPHRWTLDPNHLEQLLGSTRGVTLVVPVNSYGVPPELDAVRALARRHGVRILYDDAHGFGTEYGDGRHPADFGTRALSLHATKALPAVEGGLIVPEDPREAARLRRLRSHGLDMPLERSEPGFNARMDELRAAIALHSLGRFGATLDRRRAYGARFRDVVERTGGIFVNQARPPEVATNFVNFPLHVPRPGAGGVDGVVERFAAAGVQTRRYFHPPLHRLEIFRGLPALPVTERLCEGMLCLPLHGRMSSGALARVEAAVVSVAEEIA